MAFWGVAILKGCGHSWVNWSAENYNFITLYAFKVAKIVTSHIVNINVQEDSARLSGPRAGST